MAWGIDLPGRKMLRRLWIKFFLVLFIVSLIALSSAFILRGLMIKDFRDYLEGEMEDRVYRVVANMEGTYEKYSKWEKDNIADDAVWAFMMGLEIKLEDMDGNIIMDTARAIKSLSPSMQRRITAISETRTSAEKSDFVPYPLFLGGKEIGSLEVRFLLPEKEFIFIRRSNQFLLISLLAVGGSTILFSFIFSRRLIEPIKRLESAAKAISEGALKSRVEIRSKDEIGRLSETFNMMAQHLETLESLRKKLISDVAHELRTPTSALRGELEGMIDGLIPTDKEHLLSLYEEINRLRHILEGIEDLSQAEASALWLRRQDIKLKPFLSNIMGRFSKLVLDQGISLEVRCEEELSVNADPDRLSQIVVNLISNAIKATDRGGKVWMQSGEQNSKIFIEVGDTGHGIRPEDLPFIFERFYKMSEGGLGLGLSIAKDIAEAHGGRIEVKSVYGRGSSFTVFLPL
jgi:two-component system sensor histidine kinase BaeS